MNSRVRGRIGAVLLAGMMLVGGFVEASVAAASENIEIILSDVTGDNESTLKGEAKIKVSVKGAAGNVSAVQTALRFDGKLQYKSIDFLKGKNNPPTCAFIPPNAALVNDSGKLLPGLATNKAGRLAFGDAEDLFILTFSGKAGEEVTVSLDDEGAGSYCLTDGVTVYTKDGAEESITVKASQVDNEGVSAKVMLRMNQVKDFMISSGDGFADSKITLTVTNEKTGSTISTVLNTVADKKGGHMNSESGTPTFVVENTVVGGTTYTVEIKSPGYVTYKKTGVTFEKALEIDNASFRPGDVNADGKVNAEDKALYEKVKNGEEAEFYKEFADINRDNKVDKYDDVYAGIETEEVKKTAPAKMAKPSVDGGTKKITVSWTAPDDGGAAITGYIIRYGKKEDSLSDSVEITEKTTTEKEISSLSQGTTYYVQIAAKNAVGTGEYSDIASASTKKASNDEGGGGGGGGGGGSTGGGSMGGGSTGVNAGSSATGSAPGTGTSGEPFTDLANHAWAKDSIYTLKGKGIISGVSETLYAPANPIKRGDFILILVRMLGIDNAFEENFMDVPEGSYYYEAIGRARAQGIATGDGTNFMPENSITRQDLITLCYRAFLNLGYIKETTDFSSLDVFGDKDTIAPYAVSPMASMVAAGIIKGADGNVNPLGNATRAEVAVMCARLLDLMQ